MWTDLLILGGFLAAWLLLAPCSPWKLWRGGSCGWTPKDPPDAPPKA